MCITAADLHCGISAVYRVGRDSCGGGTVVPELRTTDGSDVGIVTRENPGPGTELNMLRALFGDIDRPSLSDTATSTMNNPARMGREAKSD